MPVTVRPSFRLVVTTAVAAVVLPLGAAHWLGGTDYRTDPPPAASVTTAGVHETLAGQEPMLGVEWSRSGSSTLVLDVGSPLGCTRAEVRIVRQDSKVVRLAAYGYLADGADPQTPCAGPVTIDLGTPLLYRRVVEDGTDHVLLAGDPR